MEKNNYFNLDGKVVVICGGMGLIGLKLVEACQKYKAKVVILDIDSKNNDLEKNNVSNIDYIDFDITNTVELDSILKKIIHKYDKIDVWINCSYPRTADYGANFEDEKDESWKANIDLHLNSYCLSTKKVAEIMKNQRFGSIINFGSIYGSLAPDFSIYDDTNITPSPAVYSAIKSGIVGFTRYVAAYYGKYGVRANVVCPGGIENNQSDIFKNNYSKKTPLGRMGKPEDIVGIIILLSSDASSYITGSCLFVDGGWSAI